MFETRVSPALGSVLEIDYEALRETVRQEFVDAFGEQSVRTVEVAHYNPRVVDVTVFVEHRTKGMWYYALRLGGRLRGQGIPVAISVGEAEDL